jgi:hypothetical protein
MVHIPVLSLPASYGDVFVSVGNDDYMGWEFSASGSMTDDLSIIASGMPRRCLAPALAGLALSSAP